MRHWIACSIFEFPIASRHARISRNAIASKPHHSFAERTMRIGNVSCIDGSIELETNGPPSACIPRLPFGIGQAREDLTGSIASIGIVDGSPGQFSKTATVDLSGILTGYLI